MASIHPAVGDACSSQARPTSPDSVYTWRACPIPTSHAVSVVTSIIFYSAVYLVYAQYHFELFAVMTTLIALVITCLYFAGLLCVLYMMCKTYSLSDMFPQATAMKRTIKTSIMEVKV
ncbi:hypothetical protein L596_006392 [Steinernema carpocapsae]|uniref:Uncharacterized protein n=1 Tax=Steinernema carpocapsae TaxID=34508 RepID=A0A4U8V3V0_STECR|nr:hypothetical protein L596_006392 [Steinernema carpocapsae]